MAFETTTIGMSISLATGASSFSVSNWFDDGMCGLITSAAVAAIASVSPSPGCRAAAMRPSVPDAPGWLITTTWRPRVVPISAERMRAMPSADPPGANGT